MAQYYWTPDPADLGQQPSNWNIEYGNVGELTVEQDAEGRYYLYVDNIGANRKAITISNINGNSLASVGDCELYTETFHEGNENQNDPDIRHLCRFSGTSGGDSTCRTTGIEDAAGVSLLIMGYIINGGITQEATAQYTGNYTGGLTVHQRSQSIGDQQKVKEWKGGNVEPLTWGLERTSSAVTQSGKVGMFSYAGDDFRLYAFGVGTNGDPAPTEEPATGGDTKNFTFNAQSVANAAAQFSKIGISSFEASASASAFADMLKQSQFTFDAQASAAANFENQKLSSFSFDGVGELTANIQVQKVSSFTFDEGLEISGEASYQKIGSHNFSALLYADSYAEVMDNTGDIRIFRFDASAIAGFDLNFSKIGLSSFDAELNALSSADLLKVSALSFDASALAEGTGELLKVGAHTFDAVAVVDFSIILTDYKGPQTILDSINVVYRVVNPINVVTRIVFDPIDL